MKLGGRSLLAASSLAVRKRCRQRCVIRDLLSWRQERDRSGDPSETGFIKGIRKKPSRSVLQKRKDVTTSQHTDARTQVAREKESEERWR